MPWNGRGGRLPHGKCKLLYTYICEIPLLVFGISSVCSSLRSTLHSDKWMSFIHINYFSYELPFFTPFVRLNFSILSIFRPHFWPESFFFIIFKKYIEEKGTSTLEFPYSLPVNWRYYYYYYLSIFKKNNIKKSTHVGQICNMKFCSYYNINFPYAPSSFLYVFLCINFFQCKYGSSLKK